MIVHAPFSRDANGIGGAGGKYRGRLIKSIDIAHYISEQLGEKISVISHTDSIGRYSISLENFTEQLVSDMEFVSAYIEKNRLNVDVLLENHVKFKDIDGKDVHYIFGATEDYINKVLELDLKHIGVLIDLCHYKGMENYYKAIGLDYLSIGDWFRLAGDKLGHIHLCGGEGYCHTDEDHGHVIEKGEYLDSIVKAIKDTGYNKDITIEVYEDDLNNAKNFRRQLDIMLDTKLEFDY